MKLEPCIILNLVINFYDSVPIRINLKFIKRVYLLVILDINARVFNHNKSSHFL